MAEEKRTEPPRGWLHEIDERVAFRIAESPSRWVPATITGRKYESPLGEQYTLTTELHGSYREVHPFAINKWAYRWPPPRDEYEAAADEIQDVVKSALVARYGEDSVSERVVGFLHVDAGILGRVSVVIA